ncbi:MAG TPA: diguanylate cyclase [Methylophilaceae bacterium]|nr:diguanylate cyclase [Methylophilaceae bacterium]
MNDSLASAALDLSPLAMIVVNPAGSVLFANHAAAAILGSDNKQLEGQGICELLSSVADDGDAAFFQSVLSSITSLQSAAHLNGRHEFSISRPDGVKLDVELTQQPLNVKDTSANLVVLSDISVRKSRELALNEASSNFHGAFQDAPIGMMLVDMEWQITRVNRSICDMLGYAEEELVSRTFQEITHPEDIHTDLELVRQMIAGDINDYRLEKRYFHKDGHVIWMLLSASLLRDQYQLPAHFIFHIQDISEYKKIQKQISEYAYQDPLTNLPNRRLLQDRLNQALTHARRYKRCMGVMFLDIDHFKAINDTHGHAFGDELIKSVASRLSECVRSADTVCRLGGDEFVIVISEITNQYDISVVARKILKSVSRPIQVEGVEAQVTMSVGVMIYDVESEDDADMLMKKADQALYEMKREGKNGFRIYK